jgi:hypothetical protein
MNIIDADELLEWLKEARQKEREADFPFSSWEIIDNINVKILEMKGKIKTMQIPERALEGWIK